MGMGPADEDLEKYPGIVPRVISSLFETINELRRDPSVMRSHGIILLLLFPVELNN
jgi:hypothetical protein